jgi:hypothetical protein
MPSRRTVEAGEREEKKGSLRRRDPAETEARRNGDEAAREPRPDAPRDRRDGDPETAGSR